MSKKNDGKSLETAREFMVELVNEFISSADLYEMSIETECGAVSLRKYDNPNKIGFKANGGKQ